MSDERQIEVKLSKRKLALMAIGSAIFVGTGIWFVADPDKFISFRGRSTTQIISVGLASIIFFGLIGFFICKKLLDKLPGLIINDEGIIDNSSAVATGQISWSDVSSIAVVEEYKQKFLILVVDNPELYINRPTSIIKRKAMQLNFKRYGSPINISSNGLQCSFQELKKILDKKFADFKAGKQVV